MLDYDSKSRRSININFREIPGVGRHRWSGIISGDIRLVGVERVLEFLVKTCLKSQGITQFRCFLTCKDKLSNFADKENYQHISSAHHILLFDLDEDILSQFIRDLSLHWWESNLKHAIFFDCLTSDDNINNIISNIDSGMELEMWWTLGGFVLFRYDPFDLAIGLQSELIDIYRVLEEEANACGILIDIVP